MAFSWAKGRSLSLIAAAGGVVEQPPAAPSSLTATDAGTGGAVDLAWTDNSSDETGFKVYQDGVLIHTTAADATSYQVTGLTDGTEYDFEVAATGASGDSAKTSAATATPTTHPDQAGVTLIAWYKPESLTALSNGAAISQWDDSSGNNLHAVQATAALKPRYDTNICNGHGGAYFDKDAANPAYLGVDLGTPVAPLSVYMVMKFEDVNSTGYEYVYLIGAQGAAKGANIARMAEVGHENKLYMYDFDAGAYRRGEAVAGGAWKRLYQVFDTTTKHTCYVDNVAQTFTADLSAAVSTNGSLFLGKGHGDNPMKGWIVEWFVVNSATNATVRGKFDTYFRVKYGL